MGRNYIHVKHRGESGEKKDAKEINNISDSTSFNILEALLKNTTLIYVWYNDVQMDYNQ